MSIKFRVFGPLVASALVAIAAPADAMSSSIALGAGGEFYRVQAGTYAALFPTGNAAAPGDTVLALDVVRPGQSSERLLVPGTAGNDVESSPSLFFEDSSRSIFVVWESRINPIHSVLYLTAMADGEFTSVVPISGDRYSFKSAPKIAVSHDAFTVDSPSGPEAHTRTIVQTVWWEAVGSDERAVYAPVVLIDGVYQGWNPVYLLDELAAEGTGDRLVVVPGENPLTRAPAVELGDDPSRAIVTFVNMTSGRLNTEEVEVLAVDLSSIAAKVRAKIASYPRIPSPVTPMASAARDLVISLGTNLHPSFRDALANDVRDLIVDTASSYAPGQIRRLADFVRAEIIDIGASWGHGFGRQPNLALAIAEVFATPDSLPTPEAPGHAIAVRTIADLPIPQTDGTATNPKVYPSPRGTAVIVSWEKGGQIFYRESANGAWSEPMTLALGPNLTADQADQLLRQRARNRS